MIPPSGRNETGFPRVSLPTQPNIDGHDSCHVHELIELKLLEMLRRIVPDNSDQEELYQLNALLAVYHDPISNEMDNVIGELTLYLGYFGGGSSHNA